MIALRCPKCRASLQRADVEAGDKMRCPLCNQKLLLPTLPAL